MGRTNDILAHAKKKSAIPRLIIKKTKKPNPVVMKNPELVEAFKATLKAKQSNTDENEPPPSKLPAITPRKTRTGKVYSRLSTLYHNKIVAAEAKIAQTPLRLPNITCDTPVIGASKPIKANTAQPPTITAQPPCLPNIICETPVMETSKASEATTPQLPCLPNILCETPVIMASKLNDVLFSDVIQEPSCSTREEIRRSFENLPNLDDIEAPKAFISFNDSINSNGEEKTSNLTKSEDLIPESGDIAQSDAAEEVPTQLDEEENHNVIKSNVSDGVLPVEASETVLTSEMPGTVDLSATTSSETCEKISPNSDKVTLRRSRRSHLPPIPPADVKRYFESQKLPTRKARRNSIFPRNQIKIIQEKEKEEEDIDSREASTVEPIISTYEHIDGKVYTSIKLPKNKKKCGIPIRVEVDPTLLKEPLQSCLKKPKSQQWSQKRFIWADDKNNTDLTEVKEFEEEAKYTFRDSTRRKQFHNPNIDEE